MKDNTAQTAAATWNKVITDLVGVPALVYSDDGSEIKRQFKERLDHLEVDEMVAERAIKTLKGALLRRLSVGVGRRNQWHLLLPDVMAQYNEKPHATIGVTPNQAYSNPNKARTALTNMRGKAKHNVPAKPKISEGDYVRVRVKPIESRGSYRVTETAWSERVYSVTGVEHTANGVMFTVPGWQGGPLLPRDVRKVEGKRDRRFPVRSREMRHARAAAERPFPVGPVAPCAVPQAIQLSSAVQKLARKTEPSQLGNAPSIFEFHLQGAPGVQEAQENRLVSRRDEPRW